ncbi:CHAT domain-containing protein [Amycolatopsis nalaikhensis]|uniref:CHAT domain-containing protein n=1 Tax=Amycolatopsis nalaikhensis TaxID=715472 RepID=A0ABY8Y1Q3_9PSEU|nr:CHAT domain-containing protein [Amycolatopsis sp. 2-2]WIV61802.1 CHAT domain-containing protein [Amycolatopsis sp. 2-2]
MAVLMHHPAREAAEDAMRMADLDPGRALPLAAPAVRLARRDRDPAALAVAERAWGHALLHCGEMDDAVRHLRRSMAAGRAAGSAALVAEARMKLAYALAQQGRPAAALREVDAALPDLTGASAARALAQRAIVLNQAGRVDEALADFRTALATLRRTGDLLGVQRMLINRAFLQSDRYAFAAAKADLLEAERLARELGRELTVGIIAENLGRVEAFRGDVPAALGHLDRAERIISEHGAQLGWVHRHRAELLLAAGVASEARESAERAVATYWREHRLLNVPEARLLLSQAAFLGGGWETAVTHARQASREFARQGRGEWAAVARLAVLRAESAAGRVPRVPLEAVTGMADTLTAAGWPAAAVEARLIAAQVLLRRRQDDAAREHLLLASEVRKRGPATLRARGWYAEAVLRQSEKDIGDARRAARNGLRILDEHAAALGATDLWVHSAAHRRELAELGLRSALREGRPAAVLEWAERGRASRLLNRPVRPVADPELAALLAELRVVVAEIDRGGVVPAHRRIALERRIRDHTRRHPGTAAATPPSPVSSGRLTAALGEHALVEFLQLDGTLHALTLAAGRLRLHALGPVAPIADLVDRVRFALHRLARLDRRGASLTALLTTSAKRLDTALLEPLREADGRPLVVAPTGALHGVPWSVLPSCAGRAVSVTPSATLWHQAVGTEAVAGPVLVASGPGLPGAEEEARAVAAIHGVAPASSTVDAVLSGLATARLAHLAAHGQLSTDNPLFSRLRLHDGPLIVHDLERLARVPHTLVLASCESGRSVVRTGDELLGLSATFIAHGTAQLVASVVPIPDGETVPLMVSLHRRLAKGEPAAAALAAAQLELRDGDPASLAAAAGFTCLGS